MRFACATSPATLEVVPDGDDPSDRAGKHERESLLYHSPRSEREH